MSHFHFTVIVTVSLIHFISLLYGPTLFIQCRKISLHQVSLLLGRFDRQINIFTHCRYYFSSPLFICTYFISYLNSFIWRNCIVLYVKTQHRTEYWHTDSHQTMGTCTKYYYLPMIVSTATANYLSTVSLNRSFNYINKIVFMNELLWSCLGTT